MRYAHVQGLSPIQQAKVDDPYLVNHQEETNFGAAEKALERIVVENDDDLRQAGKLLNSQP